MAETLQLPIKLSIKQVEELCLQHYGISGKASPLHGELDHNFKIDADNKSYVLKINRPGTDPEYLDFQEKLLVHIQNKKPLFNYPAIIQTVSGSFSFSFIDTDNKKRNTRMLEWIPGRVWSAVNPQPDSLRYSLGEVSGEITNLLQDFNHPKASRVFDRDDP